MNTSNIFKKAHALTKATIQAGDNYQATFAICLKLSYELQRSALTTNEFRTLRAAKKQEGSQVSLMVKVGSEGDKFLSENQAFATLFTKTKIGSAYIVTGRSDAFYPPSDYMNEYVCFYVTIV